MKPQTLQKTALALLVGWYAANAAAYSEQGQAGNTKSWESAEYLKDWGLTSMNASTAYALGFNGSGVKIGVMDSGVLLNHPEFQDGRIHVVKTEGTYSKDGMRYPDASVGNGPINKNEPVKNGKRNLIKQIMASSLKVKPSILTVHGINIPMMHTAPMLAGQWRQRVTAMRCTV